MGETQSDFLTLGKNHTLRLYPPQVPYEIKNADNILSMDPYGSGIRVACDSKNDPKAISVLTLPFKTAVGFVVGIDVMTKNMEKFKVGENTYILYNLILSFVLTVPSTYT